MRGSAPNLVSNADEVGIIQKRIIQNLYANPIVVCDVSGKNANVMFELGLRLAFDKPTIIVKDDQTSYSFDTGVIEHVEYRRDLRYADIIEFKEELTAKIRATHTKASQDVTYSPFLKSFGTFTVAKLDTKEVGKDEYILEELRSIRQLIASGSVSQRSVVDESFRRKGNNRNCLCLRHTSVEKANSVASELMSNHKLTACAVDQRSPGHFHIHFPEIMNRSRQQAIINTAAAQVPEARWLGANGVATIRARQNDDDQSGNMRGSTEKDAAE